MAAHEHSSCNNASACGRVYALTALFIAAIGLASCVTTPKSARPGAHMSSMVVSSTAFSDSGDIPVTYTADGIDVSPPLVWSGAPTGTKSIALIVDDPDAPGGDFVHWVVFNMPPGTVTLSENVPPTDAIPNGGLQGLNDFGTVGYKGPSPPSGTHRYRFHVYALDTTLVLGTRASAGKLKNAMRGHVLTEGLLTGRYGR